MTSPSTESLYQQAQILLSADPDSREALPLLQQAAEAGHAQSAFELASLILEQKNTDPRQALPWLEAAAAQQHPKATYNLLRLREAFGTPFSAHLEGYAWLGERGILPAQLHLLEYYADRNDPQSVYWARMAAEQNHPFGQYFLGLHHQLSNTPDLDQARNCYRQAAEQGLTVAHWQLGKIYYYGIGTAPDHRLAVQHLHQAASQGFIRAQTLLADVLSGQNQPEAIQWYQAAAGNGDLDAQASLSQHYLTGKLVGRDLLSAAKYAKAAAEYNHPEALCLMGDIYRYGLGLKADTHTALSYYRRASDLGSLNAARKLLSDAALYHPQEYEAAKAAALLHQNIERTCQAAKRLQQGIGGPIDYLRARKLYLEAAEFHHREAAAGLGMIYYHGQGVPPDYRSAAYWFEIAAMQGDAVSQYHLARLYYYGQGVSFNVELACRWLKIAIENGYENPEAFKHLLQKWLQELPRREPDPA